MKIVKKWTADLLAARVRRAAFSSVGRAITLEWLLPFGRKPFGAVILLHGSDGATASGSYFRLIMQALAAAGYAAFFPHYLESTGDDALGSGAARDSAVERSFETWQQTVGDCLAAVAERPDVDGARVALAGVSLGAYLALGAAANNGRTRCVVEICGGLPETVRGRVESMPPVLILHGQEDRVVPVERAYDLQRELAAKNVPHEMHVYPGEGHVFNREAERDAVRRVTAFLAAHLRHGSK